MGLYLESGYLDQRWIEWQADRNNINFIIEIGGRQVGKTYGVLQMMLQDQRRFILMRRTMDEMKFICNQINNPFTAIPENDVSIKSDTKYTAAIYRESKDSDPEYTGALMALSTVAKIRGFNGSLYSDLVFDEFIPENHVVKIRNEGDAFLNAVVTISGAREENGEVPLRCWLLANMNTIDSDILRVLDVADKIELMMLKRQEYAILPDRGIMIILPHSDQLMDRRKNNAVFRAIGKDSNFYKMAVGNEIAYDDKTNVQPVNIREYKLSLIIGTIAVYKHKSELLYYATDYISGTLPDKRIFTESEDHKLYVSNHLPQYRIAYINGKLLFSSLSVKIKTLDYLL